MVIGTDDIGSCKSNYHTLIFDLISDYKKTSLNTSMLIFEKFLKSLETTWKGKKLEESGKF